MPTYPKRLAVTNPSFETGPAPGDGWTTVNGTPVFRSTNPPPDIRAPGRYLQIAGNGSAGSYRVRQDIALPADSLADVDGGLLALSMRFLWANAGAGNDIGFAELAFLDTTNALLQTAASASLPDSPLAWAERSFSAPIPTGTRHVRLILGGTWASGPATDTYFDLVEAELVASAQAAGDVVQLYAEALLDAPSQGRIAQAYGEALLVTPSSGLLSQLYAELIRSSADTPVSASGGTVVCIVAS